MKENNVNIFFEIFNKINPLGYKIKKIRVTEVFKFRNASVTGTTNGHKWKAPIGDGVMKKTSYKHKLIKM